MCFGFLSSRLSGLGQDPSRSPALVGGGHRLSLEVKVVFVHSTCPVRETGMGCKGAAPQSLGRAAPPTGYPDIEYNTVREVPHLRSVEVKRSCLTGTWPRCSGCCAPLTLNGSSPGSPRGSGISRWPLSDSGSFRRAPSLLQPALLSDDARRGSLAWARSGRQSSWGPWIGSSCARSASSGRWRGDTLELELTRFRGQSSAFLKKPEPCASFRIPPERGSQYLSADDGGCTSPR